MTLFYSNNIQGWVYTGVWVWNWIWISFESCSELHAVSFALQWYFNRCFSHFLTHFYSNYIQEWVYEGFGARNWSWLSFETHLEPYAVRFALLWCFKSIFFEFSDAFLFKLYSGMSLWWISGQELIPVQFRDPFEAIRGKVCIIMVLQIDIFWIFWRFFIQIIFRDESMMDFGPGTDPGSTSRPIRSHTR